MGKYNMKVCGFGKSRRVLMYLWGQGADTACSLDLQNSVSLLRLLSASYCTSSGQLITITTARWGVKNLKQLSAGQVLQSPKGDLRASLTRLI